MTRTPGLYRRKISLGPITRDRFSWLRAYQPIYSIVALQGERGEYACVGGVMPGLCAFHWTLITPRRSWLLALALAPGCAHTQTDVRETLARRIAPGDGIEAGPGPQESPSKSVAPATADTMVRPTSAARPEGMPGAAPEARGGTNLPPAIEGATPSAGLAHPRPPAIGSPVSPDAAELDAITAAGRSP